MGNLMDKITGHLTPEEIANHKPGKTVKITVRVPESVVNVIIGPLSQINDMAVSELAKHFLLNGISHFLEEDAKQEAAKRAREREERKRRGYEKRSLRRYGIEPED